MELLLVYPSIHSSRKVIKMASLYTGYWSKLWACLYSWFCETPAIGRGCKKGWLNAFPLYKISKSIALYVFQIHFHKEKTILLCLSLWEWDMVVPVNLLKLFPGNFNCIFVFTLILANGGLLRHRIWQRSWRNMCIW